MTQGLDELDALRPFDRAVVHALSLLLTTVTRSSIAEVLRIAGVRNDRGGSPTAGDVGASLDTLRHLGWVGGEDRPGYYCVREVRDDVAWHASRSPTFRGFAMALRSPSDGGAYRAWNSSLLDTSMRDLRLSLLQGIPRVIEGCFDDLMQHPVVRNRRAAVLSDLFSHPRFEMISRLPEQHLLPVLRSVVYAGVVQLRDRAQAFDCLMRYAERSDAARAEAAPLVMDQLILRGRFREVNTILGDSAPDEWQDARAWMAFLRGDHAGALAGYRASLASMRRLTRAKKLCPAGIGTVFYPIACTLSDDPTAREDSDRLLDAVEKLPSEHPNREVIPLAYLVEATRRGAVPEGSALLNGNLEHLWNDARPFAWAVFVGQLCLTWLGAGDGPVEAARRKELFGWAREAGYDWIAAELAALTSMHDGAAALTPPFQEALAPHEHFGLRACCSAVAPKPRWQTALDGLASLAPSPTKRDPVVEPETRLAWMVQEWSGGYEVHPVEQKRSATGTWSSGRAVALRRLVEQQREVGFLTARDLAACASIRRCAHSGWGSADCEYTIDSEAALIALRGHPAVFFADRPDLPIEVTVEAPSLTATSTPSGCRIAITPILDRRPILFRREGPQHLRIIKAQEVHQKLLEILGKGLEVPESGRDAAVKTLSQLAGVVAIESDLELSAGGLPRIAADCTPHVLLTPHGQTLRVRFAVRPLGALGPAYPPGVGATSVLGIRDGIRVHANRDLDAERGRVAETVAACSSLEGTDTGAGEYLLSSPEAALSLLVELQDLGESVVIEWPKGKAIRPPVRVNLDQLRMTLRSSGDWFTVSGELQVDEGLVIELRALLDAVHAAPGAFVPIGEERLLALTEALRQRVRALDALCTRRKDALRLHALAPVVAPELGEGLAAFRSDGVWKKRLERALEATQLEAAVPATLQAELRPYQVEGFRWLASLAHAGAGACLADDMGLGKTLEALAVALVLAREGPILVVAPTSVCFSWIEQASRFAPALRAHAFGPGDREVMLRSAGPFDLIVCSYGLLLQESERLKGVRWSMVVMDEAQAIKNPETQRAAAAMSLDAGFRLAMTGTPIENRLDELWSLFAFINPGLLGSLDWFRQRFAVPIESQGRKDCARDLKRVIGPFLLRRTKGQVLQDLPPRTEIVRNVELDDFERATYEALRRAAVERVESLPDKPGQGHITVLAELMKLRRACCHARLVVPEAPPLSSKLVALGEILDELRANHHRALVFSQFVDHLAIVREYVSGRGMSCQYLDGSTPSAERKRAVTAFQDGHGELFLISLKAGGTGLNLTAADYVIHMDPWWNPAVEDQASDRAHRIGQTRPVTVYRLVTTSTVEDKILALHARKRELAERLLAGTDAAARISLDELVGLLRVDAPE